MGLPSVRKTKSPTLICRVLYDACLIFLYRLLFILYAEGRQLLPVEPKSRKYYKELSLARLVTPLKELF